MSKANLILLIAFEQFAQRRKMRLYKMHKKKTFFLTFFYLQIKSNRDSMKSPQGKQKQNKNERKKKNMKNSIITKALNDYLYKMNGFFPEINEEGEIECEVDNFARSYPETAPFLKALKEQSTEHGNVAGAVYYIISGVTVYMIYHWEKFMGLQ